MRGTPEASLQKEGALESLEWEEGLQSSFDPNGSLHECFW